MSGVEELLLTTTKFRVVRTSVRSQSGQLKEREIIRHPGACVIVPLLDDGRVCLIRNWRIAVAKTLIELPAGTLEPPEPPEVTAARELTEETGFRAAHLVLLHAFYLSPGILDERMHLYLATGLTPGPPQREAGEEIENLLLPWGEAMQQVWNGQIEDAKTLVGLMWVDRLRREGRLEGAKGSPLA
jgi:ADP-ribose pyrophosphatase